MVSIVGYSINEFIIQITMSFLLLGVLICQDLFIRIAAGTETKYVITGASSFILLAFAVFGIYQLQVRLGTVMMMNGIFISIFFARLKTMIGFWKEWKHDEKLYRQSGY